MNQNQPEMNEKLSQENGSGDYNGEYDKTNLIINYLPQSATVYDMMMLFKLAGELESVKIMKHPRTGYSYGYGFVKYISEESAAKAIELFNRLQYRNKILKVSYSRPSSQVTKNANLYISNLPKFFNGEQLIGLFGQYGEIIQHRLLRDKTTGLPRGVAFVRYARAEFAQSAINHLNGMKLANCQYPLRVRIADDYSQQRANLFYDMSHGDPRGLPQYLNRTFAQMSLRNNSPHYHRFFGGGAGDFDIPFLKGPW